MKLGNEVVNVAMLCAKAGCEHEVSVSMDDDGLVTVTHGKDVAMLDTGPRAEGEQGWVSDIIEWVKAQHV